MNKKMDIKNLRFELANSVIKGYKEVQVIFNYNGEDYKYFVFVKETKKVNYIKEAKRQFDKDLKSGRVSKTIKASTTNPRPWLIACASVLGVAALTLAGLFTWKMLTNSNPAPTPTETDCIVTFESNGGDHVDTKKVKPGSTITEPTITKANCTFDGWYEKSDFAGEKFNFSTAINKDYTFYAKWISNTSYTVTVNAGEDGEFYDGVTEITLYVEPGTKLLDELSIITKPTYIGTDYKTFDKFTYKDGSPIGDNDTVDTDGITVTGSYRNKTLEECSWKEIDEISQSGNAEAFFGESTRANPKTKTVMVNGQPHIVRIIGYGEDYTELTPGQDPDPSKAIGITFEFANLLSDENGYSLATQWNDTNDDNTANLNYLNSSIRKALTRDGGGHILWAQKGAEAWTTDPLYKGKCVLDMLPFELVSVLKTPSKYINIYNETETKWEEKTVEDKLFLLSPAEMGSTVHQYEEEDTVAYSYYEGTDARHRSKKQVKNESNPNSSIINYVEDSGQVYQDVVSNMAGYNMTSEFRGGYSWLRSPRTYDSRIAWSVSNGGSLDSGNVYDGAFAVAPAFCI